MNYVGTGWVPKATSFAMSAVKNELIITWKASSTTDLYTFFGLLLSSSTAVVVLFSE